jgi:hypothetical protein
MLIMRFPSQIPCGSIIFQRFCYGKKIKSVFTHVH